MPFGFDSTTDDVLAGVDLAGRTAVVTGGSAGLGREAARALASKGANVVLAVRDAGGKGATAASALREQVPGASIDVTELDLTALDSVRTAAKAILAANDRIELLVNNAGVMATPFGRTVEGHELHFGTNHLGHFLFTNLLAPAVVAGAPARIVNLTSAGHQSSDIVWDDVDYERRPYDKWEAYGQSKTANILFTVELERRLGPRGVHAYAVHPGMIVTELGRHLNRDDIKQMGERAKARGTTLPSYKSIEQGAATTVWCATAPELAGVGGVYCEDCHVSDNHAPWARDPESAKRLWALSEQLVGQEFPEG
ncbi:MAG TPA: SDR family NAD(P)-dependent oxidoreductase [Acidimicrobiia bacterium]|nr:SDR family NAD(P)-dependent oxidoreductase [Acidimicrobiia bacterium]